MWAAICCGCSISPQWPACFLTLRPARGAASVKATWTNSSRRSVPSQGWPWTQWCRRKMGEKLNNIMGNASPTLQGVLSLSWCTFIPLCLLTARAALKNNNPLHSYIWLCTLYIYPSLYLLIYLFIFAEPCCTLYIILAFFHVCFHVFFMCVSLCVCICALYVPPLKIFLWDQSNVCLYVPIFCTFWFF